MIPRLGQAAATAALAGALGALFLPVAAHAQGALVVTPSAVTRTGALYNYSYAVKYSSPDGGVTDLAYVEFIASPKAALSALSASTGFFVNYDTSLGYVTFLETDGSKTFAANSPVSFSFSSPYAPSTVAYDASDYNNTYNGTLLAPTIAPAPEPGGPVSLGVGLLGLTLLAARRRRCASASASQGKRTHA